MRARHENNQNLTLHYDRTWNGLPVQTEHYALINEYLQGIQETLENSLSEFPHTCVMLFVLRFPEGWHESDSTVISRFTASLIAKLKADEDRRIRNGIRVNPNRVRFCWVKEQDTSRNWHYHVAIFLNRDAYFSLGQYQPYGATGCIDVPNDRFAHKPKNMAKRIVSAWNSAIGVRHHSYSSPVHFPEHAVYSVDSRSPYFLQEYETVFHRMSYMAKVDTKIYVNRMNCFGRSRG